LDARQLGSEVSVFGVDGNGIAVRLDGLFKVPCLEMCFPFLRVGIQAAGWRGCNTQDGRDLAYPHSPNHEQTRQDQYQQDEYPNRVGLLFGVAE